MKKLMWFASAFVLSACAGSTRTSDAPSPPSPPAQAEEAESERGEEQMPPALLAAARVESVEAMPTRIEFTRGETTTFKAAFRDAEGNPVSGVRWGVTDNAAVFDAQSIKDSIPDTYVLTAVGPGEAELGIWLAVPRDTAFGWERMSSVPVRVKEWPAARVEIEAPAYTPYAGTTFEMRGRVLTIHDTEHATAEITWSSSDPSIARVTPGGVVSFEKPGRVEIQAHAEGLSSTRSLEVNPDPVAELSLSASRHDVVTGDVVRLDVAVKDRRGRTISDLRVAYSVSAVSGSEEGAVIYNDGSFVAERPGVYQVLATAGSRSASAVIRAEPRAAGRKVELVGRGSVSHVATSDLWVFEGLDGRDYAYTGTHAEGGGERMFVWDVTEPGSPVLTDSVVVDARVVNDVKVNDDATIAVITREGASDRKNGIVLLDIRDPAHPVVLSEFNDSLTAGVHNTWINGDVVYAVNDGTRALHIIDISDPANPRHLRRWEHRPGEEDKYLHDVWAKDGFAYLSYWDDGLVILDVGAGLKGGTPTEPKFVSNYKYPIGNTHTAYRYGDYVFVGDEIFGCDECVNGPRGYIHVIDVREMEKPKEVARFEVPEAGAHNIWVEDDRLYIAYYQGGLRVVDVSGELRGDLYEQGRQMAWYHTAGSEGEAIHPNSPMAWGPHPHKGYIFVSDLNSGLWVIEIQSPEEPLVP